MDLDGGPDASVIESANQLEPWRQIPLLGKGGALHNKSGEVPDMQSAIANRRFVTSLCIILSNPLCREVIDKADCIRMFQISDRRMLVAYFRTEIVRRDLLCKAAKEGLGVVRSATTQTCSE